MIAALSRLRAARPGWRRLGAAALLGALAAAGQAPLGAWWLALPALAGLMALIVRAPRPGAAAWLGWLGGAGYFLAALSWLVEPFLVDPLRHIWLAPFAVFGMAFGLALFWAGAAALAHGLGRGPALRALALALALTAAEMARGHVLTGFPWAMIGHGWIGTPVMQGAVLLGAGGLTLLALLLAALLAAAATRARAAVAAGAAAAMIAGLWLAGAHWQGRPLPEPDRTAEIRLVQPNAAQHLKWHPDWVHVFFERALELTAAPGDPDLVVWPETAVPYLMENAGPALEMVAEAAGGTPSAVGIQRGDPGAYFNSIAVIGPDGSPGEIYDKHHLVPFGEYVPFAHWFDGLALPAFAARGLSGFEAGPGPRMLDLGDAGTALAMICYETIFARHLRAETRPDWVLQATNDAWFGRLTGPYQHLAQARLRAVEQGLPVLRAANTGVSAVIDARGRIVASLPLGQAGKIDAPLPAALPPTPYARMGDGPLAFIIAVLLAGLALVRRHRP